MKIIFLVLLIVTTLAAAAQPQAKPINANDFVFECMKNGGEIPQKEMVLWIPVDFWKIIGDQMKLPPESINNLVSEMSHYMMFCVVDYAVSGQQLVFRTADEIRPSLKMVDSAKNIYLPMADKDISPTALQMISNLQPTVSKMLGQFGNGMTIFLFDAKNENGNLSFDVRKPNRFILSWDHASFTWRLPFASVLPLKYCPVDNEPMKGNWNYCPIHGAKLMVP
jgi:hypothetical protein